MARQLITLAVAVLRVRTDPSAFLTAIVRRPKASQLPRHPMAQPPRSHPAS